MSRKHPSDVQRFLEAKKKLGDRFLPKPRTDFAFACGLCDGPPPIKIRLWVVMKWWASKKDEFQGVFTTAKLAKQACRTWRYSYAPVWLNQELSDEVQEWPHARYPIRRPAVRQATLTKPETCVKGSNAQDPKRPTKSRRKARKAGRA